MKIRTLLPLLHDVVEDTDYTFADLAAMGFLDHVLDAIQRLTHKDGVRYMDYVAKIRENPIAKAVKLADLVHNSDLTRLDVVDEQAKALLEKYEKAIRFLKEALSAGQCRISNMTGRYPTWKKSSGMRSQSRRFRSTACSRRKAV